MKGYNFKYYLNDYDWVYAINEDDNHFVFNIQTGKLEEQYHCVDLYWGGCTEEYAKKRMKELMKSNFKQMIFYRIESNHNQRLIMSFLIFS